MGRYDPKEGVFLARGALVNVTYVIRAPWVPAGLCVMSIEVVRKTESDFGTWQ